MGFSGSIRKYISNCEGAAVVSRKEIEGDVQGMSVFDLNDQLNGLAIKLLANDEVTPRSI
jgi:hypothetical protein